MPSQSHKPLAYRLLLHTLKLAILTLTLYLLPTLLHTFVLALDSLQDILGRAAQSPFTSVNWMGIGLAVLGVLVWHVVVGRLGYVCVAGDGKKGGGNWGRVFGRVVIPGVVVMYGGVFLGEVWGRVF